MDEPRLRTVEKSEPPFRLNHFPADFPINLGKELVYQLATKSSSLEGGEWEAIFARLIGAEWKPSNIGLDDVALGDCAWGAKSVKASQPSKCSKVRLISGRNALNYSFGTADVTREDPQKLGEQVLSIYNARVWAVRKRFRHLRTVVLVKSNDLLEAAVFEFETVAFNPPDFEWEWNKNRNLEGCDQARRHRFTWQPHGAQFTIVEEVPKDRLAIRIKQPEALSRDKVLADLGFSKDWVQVV